MSGSVAAEPVAVCDTAVPLGTHSKTDDKIAAAGSVAKFDDKLMTCPAM
jgi:hypothetical protein